jgi:hypothetical protein
VHDLKSSTTEVNPLFGMQSMFSLQLKENRLDIQGVDRIMEILRNSGIEFVLATLKEH